MQPMPQELAHTRLLQAFFTVAPQIFADSHSCPCGPMHRLNEYFTQFETALFVAQFWMLLLRGATVAEIVRYGHQAHDALPFQGCEQARFDALWAALQERTDVETARDLLVSTAGFIDELMQALEQCSGMTRAAIADTVMWS